MPKVSFCFCFVFILLFGSSVAVFSQLMPPPTDGVLKALNDYDRAWNAKEFDTVTRLLADDYVYFSSTGSLSDRASTLEFLKDIKYKLMFVERSEVKVYRNDDKVAVISSRWKGRGSWSGGEINDDQRCGQVFVKEKGVWKLLSEHWEQIQQ